jgi:predicted metal-dependent phosphoesterase TrpH
MFEKIADLHIHSFYSDGTMSPEDILTAALANGVGLLAITDHDVLDGSIKLQKLCDKYDIQYLSSVELDSLDNGTNIHILGYGVNLSDEEFCCFVERNRILLETVSIKLIEKMQKDYDSITLSDYLEFSYDKKKGGWKALNYFMEKGLTKCLKEGLTFYSKYGCSYDCVEFPSVSLVAQSIHNAGGKAILAHPGEIIDEMDITAFQKEVLRLIDLGLDGIECYYPSHTNDITKVCLEICRDRNLLITAGSDCHGEFGHTRVGEMSIPIEQLNLENICSI